MILNVFSLCFFYFITVIYAFYLCLSKNSHIVLNMLICYKDVVLQNILYKKTKKFNPLKECKCLSIKIVANCCTVTVVVNTLDQ